MILAAEQIVLELEFTVGPNGHWEAERPVIAHYRLFSRPALGSLERLHASRRGYQAGRGYRGAAIAAWSTGSRPVRRSAPVNATRRSGLTGFAGIGKYEIVHCIDS